MIRRAAALVAALMLAPGPAHALRLARVTDGGPTTLTAVLAGRPAILMFWRADCAPCLVELREWETLRHAAAPVRVLAVGLQPTDVLRQRLSSLGIAPAAIWRTPDDPAAVLIRYGGAPPRLPLSVMLAGDGHLCQRRTGLVGPRLLREWVAQCGGARR